MTKPVVIVTGAARNIGLAVAQCLANTYCVILADIADATSAAQKIGKGSLSFQFNLGDSSQCQALVQVAQAAGDLAAIVHCAAITALPAKLEVIDPADWRRLIDINLTGTFNLMQACIPALRKTANAYTARGITASEQDVGIVLLTSRAAKTGFAALNAEGGATKAHYCASKAGVISLTKSLALELADSGIRVNGVAPGPIEGDMIPREKWPQIIEKVPLRRLGKPEDVANAVSFLLSPMAAFITGHILDVNGGTLMD